MINTCDTAIMCRGEVFDQICYYRCLVPRPDVIQATFGYGLTGHEKNNYAGRHIFIMHLNLVISWCLAVFIAAHQVSQPVPIHEFYPPDSGTKAAVYRVSHNERSITSLNAIIKCQKIKCFYIYNCSGIS